MSIFKTLSNLFVPSFHQSKVEKPNSAFIGAILLGFMGLMVLITYSISIGAVQKHKCFDTLSVLSVVILIAFASFAVGGVVGFLFGIPRTLQHGNNNSDKLTIDSNYSYNTNLEQISDWLTKIMVGVGLTQIHKIMARFNDLSYSLGGSLAAYIPTTQFAPVGVDDFPVDKLYGAFKKASGNVMSSIFFKTINIRKTNWSIDKARMERTIPIFKALIKLDNGLEFPENYAELGYAMKDKSDPDYREALANLTKAVYGFKAKGNTQGIAIVYYNRAVCRIALDNEFKQGKPGPDDNSSLIRADIDEANKEEYVKRIVASDISIKKWLDLNKKETT